MNEILVGVSRVANGGGICKKMLSKFREARNTILRIQQAARWAAAAL